MNFRLETGPRAFKRRLQGQHVLAFGHGSLFRFGPRGEIIEEVLLAEDRQFAGAARRIVQDRLPRLMAANALKSIGPAKSMDRAAFLNLLAHCCNRAARQEGFADAS